LPENSERWKEEVTAQTTWSVSNGDPEEADLDQVIETAEEEDQDQDLDQVAEEVDPDQDQDQVTEKEETVLNSHHQMFSSTISEEMSKECHHLQ